MEGTTEGTPEAWSISKLVSGVYNYLFGSEDVPPKQHAVQGEANLGVQENVHQGQSELGAEAAVVCKFFLEGKCRFGNECRNIHPEGVPHQAKNKKSLKKKVSAPSFLDYRCL